MVSIGVVVKIGVGFLCSFNFGLLGRFIKVVVIRPSSNSTSKTYNPEQEETERDAYFQVTLLADKMCVRRLESQPSASPTKLSFLFLQSPPTRFYSTTHLTNSFNPVPSSNVTFPSLPTLATRIAVAWSLTRCPA